MKSATTASLRAESLFADVCVLVKARLSLLVLSTTLVGFLLGREGPMNYLALAATLVGTALSACGASALNQWWERDYDALMKRTRDRPLPAGRMHPSDAFMFGLFFSVTGVACLALFVNALTAILAAATVAIYLLVYTPMKRVSALNTLVGAVPGALPPLIGWTAATNEVGLGGMVLFAILWFWQMPHFLAIAWMYRDDYAGAGFVILTGRDQNGMATARQSVLYSLCLLIVSLVPSLIHLTSPVYFFGALALGAAFCGLAAQFALQRTRPAARLLFFGSIIYLPLLLALLVATRVS